MKRVTTHQSLARKGYKQKQSANNLNFNSQNSTWTIGLQLYDESLVNYGTTHSLGLLEYFLILSNFIIFFFILKIYCGYHCEFYSRERIYVLLPEKKINLFNDLIKIMKKFYR